MIMFRNLAVAALVINLFNGCSKTNIDYRISNCQKLAQAIPNFNEVTQSGVLKIPDTVDAAGVIDRAVIVTVSGSSKAFFFPYWIGKGSNCQGLLWIDGSVNDFSPRQKGGKATLSIFVPAPVSSGAALTAAAIASTSKSDWFQVSVDSD